MRLRLKSIFPLIAILALFSLGESPVSSSSYLQAPYSTEWISKASIGPGKYINYNKCSSSALSITFQFPSYFFITIHSKLLLIFVNQTRILEQIKPFLKLAKGLYISGLTIDFHIIANSEFESDACLIHRATSGLKTIMCNIKINELWLSQKERNSSYYIFSKFSLKLFSGLSMSFSRQL
jgi:hypothetical protein